MRTNPRAATSDDESVRQLIHAKLQLVFQSSVPCRRVLLIKPFSLDESAFDVTLAHKKRYYNYPPYGLALLSAQLRQRGYDVRIEDLNMEILRYASQLKKGGDLAGPLREFWQKRLQVVLDEFRPDVAGLTCMFTMSHGMTMRVADFIKEKRPDLPVVVGGVHATTSPESILGVNKSVDFLSLYEGETSFCDLLDVVNGSLDVSHLVQVAALVDDEVLCESTVLASEGTVLNTLPDYQSLPVGEYRSWGEVGAFRYWLPDDTRAGVVLSNRGCRGRCSFCTVWKFHHKKVRCREVASVVDEIRQLKQQYDITHITWLDDDLFFDHKRMLKLCNEIEQSGMGITWDATNGLITSAMVSHPELMSAAVDSGCIGVLLGIESGDPDILRQMRKPSTLSHHLAAGELLKSYPQVFARGFLMIGYPDETVRQMFSTVELARRMDLDWYTVSLLTPLPATDVYEQMLAQGAVDGIPSHSKGEIKHLMKYVGYGYGVRHGQHRRTIEQDGGDSEAAFDAGDDLDRVPSRDELNDLWLLIDYRVNYEKILNLDDPLKLKKMKCFLTHVTDRMAQVHPLAHLFLGIVNKKLDLQKEALACSLRSREQLEGSDYWQRCFEALHLYGLYDQF